MKKRSQKNDYLKKIQGKWLGFHVYVYKILKHQMNMQV